MSELDFSLSDAARAFLSTAGWQDAEARPLAGDASTRGYVRLRRNGRTALLMNAPPDAEAPPCPPEASAQERRALGYNAMARLAGPNLHAFIAIAKALTQAGFSAPEIYAADARQGYALIEDLGDDLFARMIGKLDETTLYQSAMDVLARLYERGPAPPASPDYVMLDYDAMALGAEAALLMEWYWPEKKGAAAPKDLSAEYGAIVADITARLSPPHAIVLRDYHAENLLWMPARKGAARVGLIDFQDSLIGGPAYDAASLLEDARRDVAPDLARDMLDYFIARAAGARGFEKQAFLNDYAIYAAQRNAKILGVFARLARRDAKTRYLDFLPRVETHFRNDLARPGLEKLRAFFAAHMPELAP